jgi:hypothetical protein
VNGSPAYEYIDRFLAEQKAINFLQQHNSVISVESATIENDIWAVEVLTSSSLGPSIKKVWISSQTGKIIAWQCLPKPKWNSKPEILKKLGN